MLDFNQYRRHRQAQRAAQTPTRNPPAPVSASLTTFSTATATTAFPSSSSPSANGLGGLRGKLAELVAHLIEVAPRAGIPGPIAGLIGPLALKRIAAMDEAELRPALESTVVTLQAWLAEHPRGDSDNTTESTADSDSPANA